MFIYFRAYFIRDGNNFIILFSVPFTPVRGLRVNRLNPFSIDGGSSLARYFLILCICSASFAFGISSLFCILMTAEFNVSIDLRQVVIIGVY